MTELEGQLAAALERLSAQSERERQRDAEQIEPCGCKSSSKPSGSKS